jgi:hypothetical protein
MGLKCSPDIAQAVMENTLSDIKHANFFTAIMLVFSPVIGITSSVCQPSCYLDYAKMALSLYRSNVNGPSKKLTGLVIVLHHKIQNPGGIKLMPYFIWIALTMPRNCACSLAV